MPDMSHMSVKMEWAALAMACHLSGCIGLDCEKPGSLVLPASPLNMKALNSAYDDWNCGMPYDRWNSELSILFSSNRSTEGGRFDLVPMQFALEGDEDDPLVIRYDEPTWLAEIANRVNSDRDELGPFFWFPDGDPATHRSPLALVFSRGDSADHDIVALMPVPSADTSKRYLPASEWTVESSLSPLNTGHDEGYATWWRSQGRILFHSNRDGRYRIYEASVPANAGGPVDWLRHPDSAGVRVSRVEGLSSPDGEDGEERCPALLGDDLYFVSDRSGGSGGFDIYRSRWKEGSGWSAPENLGPAINSARDEYRPAPFQPNDSTYGLIFSSNRPGGLGGFDLYLTALHEPISLRPGNL